MTDLVTDVQAVVDANESGSTVQEVAKSTSSNPSQAFGAPTSSVSQGPVAQNAYAETLAGPSIKFADSPVGIIEVPSEGHVTSGLVLDASFAARLMQDKDKDEEEDQEAASSEARS